MSAFIQKVLPEAMTNYRLHLALIKSYMLDTRSASKYPIDSALRTIKDMNYVLDDGLFRLTKDTRNYSNPEDTSNQYWYEPSKDTTGMPSRSVAYAYIISLTSDYVKQYVLIGAEGHVDISTRLGHKTDEGTTWSKWRPYSDRNPSYELLQNTSGKSNTNYISFGDHELALPDARECDLGTVIRLDQWKGKGRVYSVEGETDENGKVTGYHEKDTVDTEPVVIEYGSDLTFQIDGTTITLTRTGMFDWSNDEYTLDTILIDDKFYWSIYRGETELYRSEQYFDDALTPTEANYKVVRDGLVTEDDANINLSISKPANTDDAIDTCNTYEFEVFNDHEPYNSHYNYWVLFTYNDSKDSTAKIAKLYKQSLDDLKQDIENIHERVTSEVLVLDSRITQVSGDLSTYVDRTIYDHDHDPTAHQYILNLIANISTGGGQAQSLAQHLIDPQAHENRFAPFSSRIDSVVSHLDYVSTQIGVVSTQLINYTDYTSADISEYVAKLSGDVYTEINNISNQYITFSNSINELSNGIYTSMASCCENMTNLIYAVSQDLSSYIDITSQNITEYVLQLSNAVSSLQIGEDVTSLIYVVSRDLSTYVDTTSATIIEYVNLVSQNISERIDETSSGLSSYTDQVSDYVNTVSTQLSTYVDVTSQSITDYVTQLSWNIANIDVGVTDVIVASGLESSASEDGHTIYISGVPATASDYGMVVLTSTVVLLDNLHVSDQYTVPNTNAVYSAIQQLSGSVVQVSSGLSTFVNDTSWSITDYIYKFSSSIYEYINIVDSGLIEVSGHSGIYVDVTSDNRSAHISGLPASETEYGMVYAITSLGPIDSDTVSKNHMVPTVEAVLNMSNSISNQITVVSQNLSEFVVSASGSISSTIYEISSNISSRIEDVSSGLSTYVDLTSSKIADYVGTLSNNIYTSMTSCCENMTSLIYLVSHDLSDYTTQVSGGLETFISTVSGNLSTYITTVSGGISTKITEVSGNLKTYVDETSSIIIEYIDNLPQVDPGVVSVYVSSGLYGSTTANGHSVYVSGLPATTTSYGMTLITDTVVSLAATDTASEYTVPNTNAVYEAIGKTSASISQGITYVSSGIVSFISTVSGELSTFVREVSSEIIDYIDNLPQVDPGVVSVYVSSGLYGSTTNDGHSVYISGLPAATNSYGMVFTKDEVEWVTGPVGDYTVPTVNAVSRTIYEVSNGLYTYINNVSASISTNITLISGNISTHITTISGDLSTTIYDVSKSIADTINELDIGITEVKASSGLIVDDSKGPVVTVSGLPTDTTSYGMVKSIETITWISDPSSTYVVPTVNAVSDAIFKTSNGLYTYITTVSKNISSYIDVVSTNISAHITEVSGSISTTIYTISKNISDAIDNLDFGVSEVKAISGLIVDDSNGPIVTVSGLPATMTSYGMVIAYTEVANITGPAAEFTVPTNNAVVDYVTSQIGYVSRIFGTYTSRVYGTAPVYTSRSGNDYLVNLAIDSSFYSGIMVSTVTLEDGSTYLMAAGGQPDALTSFGTVKTSDTLVRVLDTTSNYTVPTVNAVIDGIGAVSTLFGTYTSKISGVAPIYASRSGNDYKITLAIDSAYHNGVRVSTITQNGSTYLTADANIEIPDPEAYGFIKYAEVNTNAHNGIRLVVGTSSLSAYGSVITATTTNAGLNGDFGMTKTINYVPTAPLNVTASYLGPNGITSTLASAADKCIVPTINAVVNGIGAVSTIFGSYIKEVSGTAPVYVTSKNNSRGVQLAYDTTVRNGVKLDTSNINGSTYLIASAGVPDANTSIGTVKTSSALNRVVDGTSNYTVPTVNAVIDEIGTVSTTFGNYVSTVSGIAPIYTSKKNNSVGVWIAHNDEYHGGARVSTIVSAGSTYLMAEAQQPNAAALVGTVKTQNNLVWVNDTSYVYTVPTVNAVSLAIVEAIYSPSNIYNINYISNITYEIGSRYIPWEAIVTQENRPDVWAFTLGADFYIYGSNELLFNYNNPADGGGWQLTGGYTKDNFGTVITWDKISRIDTIINEPHPVVPGADKTIDLIGNPGDKFVVPTVNAVYDALQELSAKIPTITSQYIYIVSEVYTENHLYDYHTDVHNTSNYYITQVSEIHNHITQSSTINNTYNITSNFYNLVSAHNGISAIVDGSIVNLYGVPATLTDIGVVFVYHDIEWITGPVGQHTVPTVNAVSKFGYQISSSLSTYVKEVSANISTYIDGLDFGVAQVKAISGLIVDDSNGPVVTVSGLHATDTNYGMVFVNNAITTVTTPEAGYTVPTVNAVSAFVFGVSNGLYQYIKLASGGLSTYIHDVSGGLYDEIYLVSNRIANYVTALNFGITSMSATSGLTVDTTTGPTVVVSGLPATTTSYGMVVAYTEVANITGPAAEHTVPTNNAVVDYVTSQIGYVSTIFGTYTSRVSGQAPIYTSRSGNDYLVTLAIDPTLHGGVMVSTTTLTNGSTYLVASAQQPNAGTLIGTVKTQNNLTQVNGTSANYTVPTVNAVSYAIANIEIPDPEDYGYIKYTEVNTNAHNGIRLVVGTSSLSAYGSVIQTTTTNAGANGDFGVVKTINTIPTAPLTVAATYIGPNNVNSSLANAADKCIVPTVNAVVNGIGAVSTVFGKYASSVSGVAPIYTAEKNNSRGVWLAYGTELFNGIHLATSAKNGSTYLIASAGLPNAQTSLGTVKTSDTLNRVADSTSNYTVPTVNAVIDGIGAVSDVFGNYISTVSGIAPIYTAKKDNSAGVWLAHNGDYRGGVRLSTITANTSTYLVADARQPDAGANIGTVKTQNNLVYVNGTSYVYTVPTVNAVSKAIYEAIYAPSNIYNINITSNVIYEIGSSYVPWVAVIDEAKENPLAFKGGAHFYIYGDNDELHTYNEIADGVGWVNAQYDNFGTVITWDKVSHIDLNVNTFGPVVPGDANAPTVGIQGNPGDKFVVPTVNAVYNAIMELSTKIPTITSQYIYIVSEVYEENHYYDYHTETYPTTNSYITQVSEIHVTQTMSLNAYSGLKVSKVNSSTFNLSGLPASVTSYGMVFTDNDVEQITNSALASCTVPTNNAVYEAIQRVSKAYIPWSRVANADDEEYHDYIRDFGARLYVDKFMNGTEVGEYRKLFAYNELAIGVNTFTNGIADHNDWFGVVLPVQQVQRIENVINESFPIDSANPSEYLQYMGNPGYDFVVPTVNAVADIISYVSQYAYKYTANNQTYYNAGFVEVHTGLDRVTGQVIVNGNIYYNEEHVVPSINVLCAVSKDLNDYTDAVSTALRAHVNDATAHAGKTYSANAPIVLNATANPPSFGLSYSDDIERGVRLGVVNNLLKVSGVPAQFVTMNNTTIWSMGVVKTYDGVSYINPSVRTDSTYYDYQYTVPTLNALALVSSYLSAHVTDATAHADTTYTFDTGTHNGVKLVTSGTTVSAAGVTASYGTNNTSSLGVVYTRSSINTSIAANTSEKYTVPTVNAVWELSKSFYNHQANTAIHGGGGTNYNGIDPIFVYDGEISISSATTTKSGVVKVTNTINSMYYDYIVPTATAVWKALQGAGGGSGSMLFPNYGSAGGLTNAYPSGSVASGTAGARGCWLLISIVAASGAQGCVGVGINGTFIPLAGLSNAAITQLLPIPPGATWQVYNGGGSGIGVQVRVL